VSRRRVLEAVFILLEFRSPSRRIFIGSHSLPPSLVRRIGPSLGGLLRLLGLCHTAPDGVGRNEYGGEVLG
jgi:hypothetical protein